MHEIPEQIEQQRPIISIYILLKELLDRFFFDTPQNWLEGLKLEASDGNFLSNVYCSKLHIMRVGFTHTVRDLFVLFWILLQRGEQ